jgi:predicted amidophosphoribosyltransferase
MKRENNFIPLPVPEQEKKLYEAIVRCSSCKKEMGKKGGFEEEGLTTYGTCPECLKEVKKESEEFKKNNPPEKE